MLRPILLAAWICTIALGFCVLTSYQQTPSHGGNPKQMWPTDAEIAKDSTKPTLVMFVHPHCPCTRASLNELAVLMAKCHGRISAYVLLVRPNGLDPNWAETDLKRQATDIPGVVVLDDESGHCAKRFRIHTSGGTVVYDAEGQLCFSGGMTASRGHNGDNIGRQSIESLVLNGSSTQTTAPVFGCPLLDQPSDKELSKID